MNNSKPHRVLHVIPSVSPKRGGPSQGLIELVREQVRTGIDVVVVTTNDDAESYLDVPLRKQVDYYGIPVIFLPKWDAPIRALREFTVSLAFHRWLIRNVHGFDVVHIHALFSFLPSLAMRYCRRKSIPYIVRPSGLLCRWSLTQSKLRKTMFLALSDRAGLNAASMIEYTADLEREEASDLGLVSPTCVVPYGVHVAPVVPQSRNRLREKLGLNEAQPLILYMSRVHPKKGIELLLDAFERWERPDKFLVIAGHTDGEYDRKVMERVQSGPCRDKVCFWGFATGEGKQLLLQGADVFVLPSYSESFGIVVAEAIAAGLPVITTRGVPLYSFIERYGFGWIVGTSPASITEALETRFSSEPPEELRNVQARGRETVQENFGWERIGQMVSTMYSKSI